VRVTSRIKVGLLGAGYIVNSHAQALTALDGVELYAVCDTQKSQAERAAKKFNIPRILTSITELAASDCDVVHILLPPALHIDAASAMIEAGKSVFLEKPMGLDSARCLSLYERARQKGLALGVNHNFLFSRTYEQIRSRLKSGEYGRIDQISVNWHFGLPILNFGPFDNWMLAAPANIIFEVAPHLCAFVVDLVGLPAIRASIAGSPIELRNGQTVYRHWTAAGDSKGTAVVLSLSLVNGQPDRILRLRGRGGSAQIDFGRDFGWPEVTASDNPIFDAHATAGMMGRRLRRQAGRDRLRRVKAALLKRSDANPFEESVFRSVTSFYAGGHLGADDRHDGLLGINVIRLCEQIVSVAGVGPPSFSNTSVKLPISTKKPTILVVGGTGFIGRGLVRTLASRGYGVRVLTRNLQGAAAEFDGSDVELMAGSHGDPSCAKKAVQGIDIVYHLAKCEGKRWQDYVEGDIEPTRVLAEAAAVARVKRFVYTGTIASYACGKSRDVIDNLSPLDRAINNRGHYARSKAMCEELLQAMQRDGRLPLVILRPGIVIGPGSAPTHPGVGHFSSETSVEYWGDGSNTLPFIVVDDVVDALVRALDAPGIEGQTLLLTSPPLITAREYVEALALHMRTRIQSRQRAAWRYWAADLVKEVAKNLIGHPNRHWPTLHDWQCRSHLSRFDSRDTERVLGWRPVNNRDELIAKGIKNAVEWYLR
jgi:nucleoside-diphosphate-sugar epimerase/predicted dehydrogenase